MFHIWWIVSVQAPRIPRRHWAPGRLLMQLPNYGCRVSHCASRSLSYLFYRCVKRCANAIIDQRSLGASKNNGLDHVNVEPVMANTISRKRRRRRHKLAGGWGGGKERRLGVELLRKLSDQTLELLDKGTAEIQHYLVLVDFGHLWRIVLVTKYWSKYLISK